MSDTAPKVAIVTGGARGIGRGCALELAARGYDIALVDLLEPEMARTKGEIEAKGRKALTYKADVASFARAAEEAGADAVSLVNTFLAMVIDVETRKPAISNGVGGLSGPAIRPIAVRMVYECRQLVKIPIVGMGGISDARDALEFIIAGASAVQVGTANFVDPLIWPKLLDGIRSYMDRHKVARIADLVGTVQSTTEVSHG